MNPLGSAEVGAPAFSEQFPQSGCDAPRRMRVDPERQSAPLECLLLFQSFARRSASRPQQRDPRATAPLQVGTRRRAETGSGPHPRAPTQAPLISLDAPEHQSVSAPDAAKMTPHRFVCLAAAGMAHPRCELRIAAIGTTPRRGLARRTGIDRHISQDRARLPGEVRSRAQPAECHAPRAGCARCRSVEARPHGVLLGSSRWERVWSWTESDGEPQRLRARGPI